MELIFVSPHRYSIGVFGEPLFLEDHAVSYSTWFHVMIVFYGLDHGEGFTVVYNGGDEVHESRNQVGKPFLDTTGFEATGDVLIGAVTPETPGTFQFPDLNFDELMMWNKKLTLGQIKDLYDTYFF